MMPTPLLRNLCLTLTRERRSSNAGFRHAGRGGLLDDLVWPLQAD
jgi:hypothetical protein